MSFDFFKMHGAGNDFIVVDNRFAVNHQWSPPYVRTICRAHTGIGADGLLLIEKDPTAGFRMRFYNSDGYEADMCANGSRCICLLAHHLGVVGKKFSFRAGDGIHRAEILDGSRVKVELFIHPRSDPRTFPVDFKLPDSLYFKKFLDTGVPHVVLGVEDLSQIPVETIGKDLRFHPYYQPEGTNVNFVEVLPGGQENRLKLRTYERGVDAETLSCGTGATAAAIAFYAGGDGEKRTVHVATTGGALTVSFTGEGNEIHLLGPVEIVYKGTYFKEEL
jgi:diaminopimelate epimerase